MVLPPSTPKPPPQCRAHACRVPVPTLAALSHARPPHRHRRDSGVTIHSTDDKAPPLFLFPTARRHDGHLQPQCHQPSPSGPAGGDKDGVTTSPPVASGSPRWSGEWLPGRKSSGRKSSQPPASSPPRAPPATPRPRDAHGEGDSVWKRGPGTSQLHTHSARHPHGCSICPLPGHVLELPPPRTDFPCHAAEPVPCGQDGL